MFHVYVLSQVDPTCGKMQVVGVYEDQDEADDELDKLIKTDPDLEASVEKVEFHPAKWRS